MRADRDYKRAFAKAFPARPARHRRQSEEGDRDLRAHVRLAADALRPLDRGRRALRCRAQEIEGFRLFNGKAGCANCHSGWAFTDYAFYDIGLPSDDRGRGAVLRLEQAEYAFKTPSLREAARARALHA